MRTLALALTALAAHGSPWTLQHARHMLATSAYLVTDPTQSDTPVYDLTFTKRQASALIRSGRRFVFAGTAHDAYTDEDVPVSFTLTPTNTLAGFAGPPADTSQPSFPIRATFYYAWYPEAWTRGSQFPYTLFRPTLDYYSANDANVIREQTDAMRYGHFDAGIYSWWGRNGYPPTDERFWRYLAEARTTSFRWALYYEREGYENPSVEKIHADLQYIRSTYASSPAYLKIEGRFVVFVYGGRDDNCDTVRRWRDANADVDAYLVLMVFPGYRECVAQPDAWHHYEPVDPEYRLAPDSFMISPAFDAPGDASPRLVRDLDRWKQNVADMVASNAEWQLVETFNEWPEGTAVESAREWASPSGYGQYLDVLHDELSRP